MDWLLILDSNFYLFHHYETYNDAWLLSFVALISMGLLCLSISTACILAAKNRSDCWACYSVFTFSELGPSNLICMNSSELPTLFSVVPENVNLCSKISENKHKKKIEISEINEKLWLVNWFIVNSEIKC